MKRQIAKVIFGGTYRIIQDDEKTINPFRVTKNGKKVVDYADLESCMFYLYQITTGANNGQI